jgi:hypothetical protein
MDRVMSEDAVRRGMKGIDEAEGIAWQRRHLDYCTMPTLGEPWILDVDTTVKPLYGHQQGAGGCQKDCVSRVAGPILEGKGPCDDDDDQS